MNSEVRELTPGTLDAWVNAVGSVLGIRVIAVGIGFLATVLAARLLGPAAYGQFAILVSIMTIVAGFSGPPLDTSLVRFTASHVITDPRRSAAYFRLVWFLKCVFGALLLSIGLLTAGPLAGWLHLEDTTSWPMRKAVLLAFAGGVATTFMGLAQTWHQAHQRFFKYVVPELVNSVLRFAIVLPLFLFRVRDVTYVFIAYVVACLIATGAAWWRLPRERIFAPREPGMMRPFYDFAKWVFLASLFTSLAQRFDILILGAYKMPQEAVGNYGAALNLTLLGDLLVISFYQVLLPKASHIRDAEQLAAFLRRFLLPVVLCIIAVSPLIIASGYIVRIVFGDAFAETGRLFPILFAGALASLGSVPAATALYGLGRPRAIAVIEGFRLLLTLVSGVCVVPLYGVIGMAWAMALVRGITSLLTYVSAEIELRRLRIRARIT